MADYFLARGGEVRVNSRLQRIELNGDGSVSAFRLADGTTVQGDLYVSAMPGACLSGVVLVTACMQAQWLQQGWCCRQDLWGRAVPIWPMIAGSHSPSTQAECIIRVVGTAQGCCVVCSSTGLIIW